jgi:L-2-hydroxyglutarate oxidase
LTGEELRDYEPHAAGVAGLWVPDTGIVDYRAVAEAFALQVRSQGGRIETGAPVIGFRPLAGEMVLETRRGVVRCRALVNCGGLWSDRLAVLCGVAPGLRLVPFRGEYYDLRPERRHLVHNLIYPMPDPRLPFLGVHLTRRLDGTVEAGPNAVLALKRAGYGWLAFHPRDAWEILTYPGTWRMSRRYWRTGLAEIRRTVSKRAFLAALRALVPELEARDLRHSGAGVRAQAVEPSGALVDDFRILEAGGMIHVLNAPSPAATASMSIGRSIAALAVRRFGPA